MILSIGEILVDFIGENNEYKMFCGGAPFNVAVNAKIAGASVGFVGRVGKDPAGKFIIKYAEKVGLDFLNIQIDNERNTTLAFVTLTDGESDFAFFRHETADYNINSNEIDFSNYNIIHLGSLMLSEEEGERLANRIVEKTRKEGKILSFDVNFRLDLFKNTNEVIGKYKKYVEEADILKFSEDELVLYTGEHDIQLAVKKIFKPNRLLLITLGSKGSMYSYNNLCGMVETVKIKPIDTTGAGDAFFGTLLAEIDKINYNNLTEENLKNALIKSNKAGANATQFKGAIKLY